MFTAADRNDPLWMNCTIYSLPRRVKIDTYCLLFMISMIKNLSGKCLMYKNLSF